MISPEAGPKYLRRKEENMPIISSYMNEKCRCGHTLYSHGYSGCDFCSCPRAIVPTLTDVSSDYRPGPQGDPTYLSLLDEMKDLHIRKNAGYSGDSPDRWANFRLSESLGVSPVLGVLVRMSDKWIRITNLIKNKDFDLVGEAIEDTLMDLAAYCLIAVCLLREGKKHENN